MLRGLLPNWRKRPAPEMAVGVWDEVLRAGAEATALATIEQNERRQRAIDEQNERRQRSIDLERERRRRWAEHYKADRS
jgi:hypothetical protein